MVHRLKHLNPLRGVNPKGFLTAIVVGFIIYLLPTPSGIEPKGWTLFAIFIGTIVAAISKPLPMGGLALIAAAICVATKTLTMDQVLDELSSNIVWLIVFAFFISKAFIKTGLGNRVAYFFIGLFGKNTLGLSYSLILTETFLSPFIPSNSARGAGISFPIFKSIAENYGSTPEKFTERRIGSFLCLTTFHANVITSALFLTAMVGNPMLLGIAKNQGVHISWLDWAYGMLVPGFAHLLLFPLVIYFLYPPELKHTPEAAENAKQKAKALGPLNRDEKIMITVFSLLLTFWVFGSHFKISATETALFGVCALMITGVLTWDDMVGEKDAWMTLVWFSILIMMGKQLNELGLTKWFSGNVSSIVSADWSWVTGLVVLGAIYFTSHYFFTSIASHITALFAAFLMILTDLGAPAVGVTLFLGALTSISASTTHYGTGPAVIFFGSNYVDIRDWWKMGAAVGFLGLAIWSTLGIIWLKAIGYL